MSVDAQRIAKRLGGADVLEVEVHTGLDLALLVKNGFPSGVIAQFKRDQMLTAQEFNELIPKATLSRRTRAGRLTSKESAKLERVARIEELAIDTFVSQEKASGWLRKPNWELGGEEPLRLAISSDVGARLVEETLGRIAYGVY